MTQVLDDQRERWSRGECPPVEDLLRDQPAADRELVLDLVYQEILLREAREDSPSIEEYCARFPELTEDLRLHFEAHSVFGDLGGALDRDAEPLGPAPEIPGYELGQPLGAGGMGVVYEARQTSLGRQVALKLLPRALAADDQALERFRREARTASALNHPHICTIYDLGQHEGKPYIVMERIHGRTLRASMGRPMSVEQALPIIRQAAMAFEVAHDAGVVHRDIKPENLMVRDDGLVKVLDFGLARLASLTEDRVDEDDTLTGTLAGTLHYMSPEQLRAEAVGSPSDVFALGVVWHELCTGRHPFAAGTLAATLRAIQQEPAAAPSRFNDGISPSLEALMQQMLAKDPLERPTMEAVLRRLDEQGHAPLPRPPARPEASPLVGREAVLTELWHAFDEATAGRGTLLALTGEPGIGKTRLAEQFLQDIAATGRAFCIARGRCSQRLAGAEAYLPVLEALDGLLRGPNGEALRERLRRVAPTWYGLCDVSDGTSAAAMGSPERLQRELLTLLGELGRDGAVVLLIDDLHWADLSTIDLLSYVASRCERLPLLLLVSYRPSDLLIEKHPFGAVRLDLQARGILTELALPLLTQREISRHLGNAFPRHRFPPELPGLIHQRTEGHPLFVVELLRYLREREVLQEHEGAWSLVGELPSLRELPDSMRGLIQRQLDRLSQDDHRLLSAASVQGLEFDSVIVARALDLDPAWVEERLADIQRVHALVRVGPEVDLPDGTPTLRSCFSHALYQAAFFESLPPTRRRTLSASTADAMLLLYGDKVSSIATTVAMLLETARDAERGPELFCMAASHALRTGANREAAALAERGHALLLRLPESPPRADRELGVLAVLGMGLLGSRGYADPDVERVHSRALSLCQQLADSPRLFPILWGLGLHYLHRGEVAQSTEIGIRLEQLAAADRDAVHQVQAEIHRAVCLLHQGRPHEALPRLQKALDLYDPAQAERFLSSFGGEPRAAIWSFQAWGLWLTGESERATDLVERLRNGPGPSLTYVHGLFFSAYVSQLLEQPATTQSCAEQVIDIGRELGLTFYVALAQFWRAWAIYAQGQPEEGIAAMEQSYAMLRGAGARLLEVQILGMQAEALGAVGRLVEALERIDESRRVLAETGERYFEAEIDRIEGQLRALRGDDPDAEARARRGLALAREQGEHVFELRAATRLARLLASRGDVHEAREILAPVLDAMATGGNDSDRRAARDVLAGLG